MSWFGASSATNTADAPSRKRPAAAAVDLARPSKRGAGVQTLASLRGFNPVGGHPELPKAYFEYVERPLPANLSTELVHELDGPLREAVRFVDRRRVETPRSELWFSTNGEPYPYSGRVLAPRPVAAGSAVAEVFAYANDWLADWIARQRAAGGDVPDAVYEGMLCNGYLRVTDAVGWHADDEPTIDQRYPILSISLGRSWIFSVREVAPPNEIRHILLQDSDVLAMLPNAQKAFTHQIKRRLPGSMSVHAARVIAAAEHNAAHPDDPIEVVEIGDAAYDEFRARTNALLEWPPGDEPRLRINLTFRVYKHM